MTVEDIRQRHSFKEHSLPCNIRACTFAEGILTLLPALFLSPFLPLQPLKEVPNNLIVAFNILSLRRAAEEGAELVLAHFHVGKRKDLNNVFVN